MKPAIDRPVLPPSGPSTRSSRTRFPRAILHHGIQGSFGHSLLMASLPAVMTAQDGSERLPMADVIDVSRPTHGERTFLQLLVSLFGAAGIALLFGIGILLIGLPIVSSFGASSKRSAGSSASTFASPARSPMDQSIHVSRLEP